MKNELLKVEVIQQNGILVVDSRIVSKELGVLHKNLITKIESYLNKFNSAEVSAQFYILGEYKSSDGRMVKMYWITEKGIAQLLGGYSSAVPIAFELNVAYINEFERMKNELNKNSLPKTYKEALIELLHKVEENERLELENKELKPKADKFLAHMDRETVYNAKDIATRFGLGVVKFNKKLVELDIQYKYKGSYKLNSIYEHKGYTKYITMERKNENDEIEEYQSMKWTEKGFEFLEKKFLKNNIVRLKEENEILDDGVRYVSLI